MGWNAYDRMIKSGRSNQQIQAGVQSRGLKVGQKAFGPLSSGAQPNWMNQYTGSMGNIGLSTYNRMKTAGYNVLDIQRDQPASGMIFGAKASEQMNKDLEAHYAAEEEKEAAGSRYGEADTTAGYTAQGLVSPQPENYDKTTGGTTSAFGRDKKKKKKEINPAMMINPIN